MLLEIIKKKKLFNLRLIIVLNINILIMTGLMSNSEILPVWDFDRGLLTDQGGFYNHFGRGKSEARIHLVRDVYRGVGGRSMKISYKKDEGWAGVWLHLFDEELPVVERKFLNIVDHQYLSFFVKGEEGGENFSVQAADPNWFKKDDSRSAGVCDKFMKGSVTTQWQEVVIPWSQFNLGSNEASTIVFNFTVPGKGTIFIDDINFKSSPDSMPPFSDSRKLKPGSARNTVRAMWVWEVEKLLLDQKERDVFFKFCQDHKISELFLQIPYKFENDLTPFVVCVLKHPGKLAEFIKSARKQNILCHALDGFPEFSLSEHHPRVLAQVNAIIDFNRAVEPDARYYGVHLDNEPYQLLGFDGPEREKILTQFLDLNQKIMDLIANEKSDLVYGVDIPFWFDEGTEDNNYIVTFNGERKDSAKHLIDILDNVGIMDYRNFAGGADGMIRHAEKEIEYANWMGKKIYLGIETFKYKPTKVSFLNGLPESDWIKEAQNSKDMQLKSIFNGFKVRNVFARGFRFIGLLQQDDIMSNEMFNDELIKLYNLYGSRSKDRNVDQQKLKAAVDNIINNDGRYNGYHEFSLVGNNDKVVAEGFETTEVMLEKITFADRSKTDLEMVIREVNEAFEFDPSYIGVAIHYYDTYKNLSE